MKKKDDDKVRCEKCDDTGVWEFAPGESTQCACRVDELRKRRHNRMRRGIPRCFHPVAWERPPIMLLDPKILRGLRRYVATLDEDPGERQGPSLWLSGPIGTGKSSAAALIALEAAQRGYDTSWWGMSKLLSRLKATFVADSTEHAYGLREEISRYDLLVLDDIGTIRAGEWIREELYLIVNDRYETNRPIVLTTDVDVDGMRKAIGARTVSRLIEMAGKPIEFDGPDHRAVNVYGT